MIREKSKWKNHKDESTDARHRDGLLSSSDESLVMRVERREQIVRELLIGQPESITGRDQWIRQSRLKYPNNSFGKLGNK
jgi:hypothetical protein